ncbi:TatD DNase family Scn1 [Melanogaster broomeanus]|nr:TatD DNase family Scn1 [Melanogaster broomeanus]
MYAERPSRPQPPLDVLRHVVDVHCHPTDSEVTAEAMDNLSITICAMSSRQSDQLLVRDLANAYPDKVVPCFGYHPWFSHWISLEPYSSREEHFRRLFSPSAEQQDTFARLLPHLPDPVSLADVLTDLRQNLSAFPQAMLGEVGLDRAARVPIDYFASLRELTPFTVPLEHQLAILESQVDLAVELGRNVSIHSVKSHLATLDLLDRMHKKHGPRWLQISIDLHSCGISPETWRAIEKRHTNVYMSLSTVINGRSPNHRALIAACSSHRILVESDYHPVDQCAERTWDMVLAVAEIKGWFVETTWMEDLGEEDWGVVRRLEKNWKEFRNGNHGSLLRSKEVVRKLP